MTEHASASVDEPTARSGALFHNADAYIPGDRRRALAAGIPMPDRVAGAGLFADISGFTPLTEALAREFGPQRGAEELTAHLNRVFEALISTLERYGGEVIYFSGDAITCWLDGDAGARATACALAMQQQMALEGEVVTPGGARVRLAMKAAVAVGAARRFVVGDPDIQRIDVLAGRLIDRLAAAERHAERGEVLLDAAAAAALDGRVAIRDRRVDGDGRTFTVVEALATDVADAPVTALAEPLPSRIAGEWLLPDLHERLRSGRGEFLAELRPAYSLFLRFGGIDYDDDEDAIAKLDAFIRQVQRAVTSYGGNLLHLTLGDKGAYLFVVFGSPQAHEDDGARAATASLALRDLAATTAVADIQIGIAYGRLRSGTYGHPRRQAFTCLGDSVNLAARLMSTAPPGCIYVTERARGGAGEAFAWEALAPVSVKGKAEPIPIFALTGTVRRAARERRSHELPMVGRAAELGTLGAKLDIALAGQGQVVGVAAEAGMGKSRLVAEFLRTVRARGIAVAVGECQSYGTNTAYFAWRPVWTTLFGLDTPRPGATPAQVLEAELGAIDPALVARAPLLSGLLDVSIADNELTGRFDAKLRKTSLEALLAECLRARAAEAPRVLVLEDCHWLDALSRDLLDVLARTAASLRVLLVLLYRPATRTHDGPGMEKVPHLHEIALTHLDEVSAAALIRSKHAQIAGRDADLPRSFVDRITARAQGNPFYIEELLNFIRSHGIDAADESALKRVELPESLHSLILSRIDTLAEAPRQTLKVASVLGRVFRAPALPGIYPALGTVERVRDDLRTLGTVDLVNIDQDAQQTYLFKHVVTQEVAYESMPFAFRSMLHERVGAYIEATEAEAIERNLDLLAHHYGLSENRPKKCEYLQRAGDAARASYANAAAIEYFERLVPLVQGRARVDAMLKLGTVLELVGAWVRAEKVDRDALGLADDQGDDVARASCQAALAEVARKQGRYDEALAWLDQAVRGFTAGADESGVGRVLHLAGTIAAQRGDYDKAVENYEASLGIRQRIGDKPAMASLLSNLGIIAEYRSDYDGSRAFHERALALRSEIDDRRGVGNSTNNLGMIAFLQKRYEEAGEWFRKSILLNREVGDAWMVALCHENLGNAARGLGDYATARHHYADSLRDYRDYEDKYALAFLLEDVGILAALSGDAIAALELIGAADAFRQAIGAPRAPALADDIEKQITGAGALAVPDRAAHRDRGRALGWTDAVAHALAWCESTVDDSTNHDSRSSQAVAR